MSRICVKNLPKLATEDRIRNVFSQKGEVTDAKLMRTKEGKSRQFAFVGFRTAHEAEEAIKYFNKSYFDSSRIVCELARTVGDPDIPRPWSKYSLNKENKTTEDGKKISGTKNSSLLKSDTRVKNLGKDSGNDDPKLQEFLEVMQPRVKSKLWANDTLIIPATNQHDKVNGKQAQTQKEPVEKSQPVHMESGENNNTEDRLSNPVCADVSDMDYFKSRVKKNWSDSDSSDGDDSDSSDDEEEARDQDDGFEEEEARDEDDACEEEARDEGPPEDFDAEGHDQGKLLSLEDEKENLLESARLFVRNLPYTATEEELKELFSKFGTISEVHIVLDKDTKRSKGFAYILYTLPEFAARALEEVDNSIFQGRLLHVMPAKLKNPSDKLQTDASSSQDLKTFKQKRVEERKASEAGGDTRSWNTLFMRPDTVVENIARKFGVNKSDLLDGEADDLAVRLALGEAQVIEDTKNSLTSAGVNVKSLEDFAAGKADGMKRSNHVLLVKNLPFGSSDGELAKMFGKFGSLDKIFFPPTKILALVVFLEPAEARAAFKGLAYKRYKDAPLYLEWAPANVLSENFTSDGNKNNAPIVDEHDAKKAILEQYVEGISEEDADPDRVESRSLFVKNLNFKTSDESLRKHFSEHIKEGTLLSVKIKKHLKNGKYVSMGFGFLEFDSMETATKVLKDLQGTVLDGHALILQLCHSKNNDQVVKKAEKDKSSTKLLVRNVAFQATEKDLRQLFSPFGQIKRLRLPMKLGSHRGFAFVEFVTKQEAQNALKALSNTHLYGRHLVLERAKEGETFEELRARTTAQFADEKDGSQNPTKLSKKRKQMAILDEGEMKFRRTAD